VRPDFDCVVIGAGLVGAAQALAIRRHDLSVLVVEAQQPPSGRGSGDVRGLALSPPSKRFIEVLGVWNLLSTQTAPVRHIHVSDQGRFGFTHLNSNDIGIDALGYVCPADHFLRVIRNVLIEKCEVWWGTTLSSINLGSEFAQLWLESASGPVQITTRLVIGADGMNSRVREAAGVVAHMRDYRQSAIVANVDVQYPVPETAFERFTGNGPLALLPLPGGRQVTVRCCSTDEVDRIVGLSDKQYLAELEEGFGHRFGVFSDVGKRRAHKLVLQFTDRIVGHRVALIGAAANKVHPNGAQGLNLGLRDAAALAECLSAIRSVDGDIGDLEHLSGFAAGRQVDHREVIHFTDIMAQVFISRIPMLGVARNLAMLVTDISPSSKRWFIGKATGLSIKSPRLDIQVTR
tara:strand:- start:1723 stop:2934 length:1212 start_codon:yes stop_codon:yes gene_type:complete